MTALERETCRWENQSGAYVMKHRNFKSQYAQMYFARLMELGTALKAQAAKRWPNLPVTKLLCLEDGLDQVAVGTLYKDMILKPTVLKEYTENETMAAQLNADSFVDASDQLLIEDESARIKLSGKVDVAAMVTGVIVAVRGLYDAKTGCLCVAELAYAGVPTQPRKAPALEEDKFVAVTSGLCVGDPAGDAPRLMLLVDWLRGMLGDASVCRRVARLVICGGTLGSADELATAAAASKQQRFAMEAVQDVDRCITELASALPVDLMPGPGDASSYALPQQPLHRCLFPGAAPYESFHRVTNPYRFSADGVSFLGTSGQNVADVLRYSEKGTTQSVMQDQVRQRHLCSTAPDTLACFPFVDEDPFILREAPHVYFVGNQAGFSADVVTGDDGQRVATVSVPSFARTGSIVLVNLRTLESRSVVFDADL